MSDRCFHLARCNAFWNCLLYEGHMQRFISIRLLLHIGPRQAAHGFRTHLCHSQCTCALPAPHLFTDRFWNWGSTLALFILTETGSFLESILRALNNPAINGEEKSQMYPNWPERERERERELTLRSVDHHLFENNGI